MKRRVLFVTHPVCEFPGVLGERVSELGMSVDTVDARELYPSIGTPDLAALVVLGSIESAGDDKIPWLVNELDLLHRAIEFDVPIFGVCFGAQLLARALGGVVHRGGAHEYGWEHITTDEPALSSGPWLLWHDDTFTMPPGGKEIARTTCCSHAFIHGRHLGVQFHPEVTPRIVEAWWESLAEREVAPPDRDALMTATRSHAAASRVNAVQLLDWFLSRAASFPTRTDDRMKTYE